MDGQQHQTLVFHFMLFVYEQRSLHVKASKRVTMILSYFRSRRKVFRHGKAISIWNSGRPCEKAFGVLFNGLGQVVITALSVLTPRKKGVMICFPVF